MSLVKGSSPVKPPASRLNAARGEILHARAAFVGDSAPSAANSAPRSAQKTNIPALASQRPKVACSASRNDSRKVASTSVSETSMTPHMKHKEVISVPELMERIKISNTDHSNDNGVSQDTLSRVAMHVIQEHEKRVRMLNKSLMMDPPKGPRQNMAKLDELDELRGSMHLLLAALRSFEMVLDLPPSAKPDHVEAALHSLDMPRNLGVLMELLREMDDVTKEPNDPKGNKMSMSEVSTLQGIMGTLRRERQESIDRAAGTLQEPGTREALAHLHQWTKTPALRHDTPLGEVTAALAGPEMLWEHCASVLAHEGWRLERPDLDAAKKSQANLLGLSPVQCETLHALEAGVRALTFQMELLHPLFGPVAAPYGATLAAFQGQLEVLSRLRDLHMLADRLEPHSKQLKGSLKALKTMHDRTWESWTGIRSETYSVEGHSALLEPLRWRGNGNGKSGKSSKNGGGKKAVKLAPISDEAVQEVTTRSDDDALAAAAASEAARTAERAEAQAREDMAELEKEVRRAQKLQLKRDAEVQGLRTELEKRKEDGSAVRRALGETEEELGRARKEVAAKQEQLADLEARLKAREEDIASLEKQRKKGKKVVSQTAAQAAEMRKALKVRSKKLKALRLKLKAAKDADVKSASKETAKELERVRAEIGVLMQQTSQLEDERDVSDSAWATVRELQARNAELEAQIKFDPDDVRALRNELTELQDERDRADAAWARIQELQARNRELEAALGGVAEATHAATANVKKGKAIPFGLPFPGSTRSEVEALKSRIRELEARGDLSLALQAEASALRKQVAELEAARDDAVKKESLATKVSDVKVSVLGNVGGAQAVRDLRKQLADALAAAESSAARAGQLERDRDEAAVELGKTRLVITDMTAQMVRLKEGVQERDAEIARLVALLEAREKEAEEMAAQLATISAERDDLERRLEAEVRDRNVLQGERDAVASQLDEASRRLENAASENQRLRGLLAGSEGEIARLSMHLESSEAEVSRLTLLLESADGDAAQATARLEAAETEAARLRGLAESTESEVARLTKLLVDAEAEVRGLGEKSRTGSAEVDRLGELLVASEDEVTRLRAELDEARQALGQEGALGDEARQLRELLDGSEQLVTQLRIQVDQSMETAADAQAELERLRVESGAATGAFEARLVAMQRDLEKARTAAEEAQRAADEQGATAEDLFTLDGYINLRAYMIFRAERYGTDSTKEQQVADWKRAEAEVNAERLAGATTKELAADYRRRCSELIEAGDQVFMGMDFARAFAAKALRPANAGPMPSTAFPRSHPMNLI